MFLRAKNVFQQPASRYGNTNFVMDNVRHGTNSAPDANYSEYGGVISNAITAITSTGGTNVGITYLDGVETNHVDLPHITNAPNVAAYISWGFHSSLGSAYAVDGKLKWTGNSAWYVVETIESFNGYATNFVSGTFVWWFDEAGFGGTNYSNTPVGAVSHVDEPGLSGVNSASPYFGLWSGGKNFAICAWNSRNTPYFQAVGDPFVRR